MVTRRGEIAVSDPILVERVLDATCSNEFYVPAEACRVKLSRKDIERLINLAEIAKTHNVASIRDWSSHVEWGVRDEDDDTFSTDHAEATGEQFRSECDQVAVYAGEMWETVLWTTYERHSSIKIVSEEVPLEELKAALNG
jgi:hypothetical protein